MIIDFGNDGKGGGTSCKLQEVSTTITTNGLTSIVADAEYDGMSKVDVNVNIPEPYLVPLTVNSNGVYNPQEGEDGFSSVDVNVPAPEIKLQEKTTTTNGSVIPDNGYDGLSKVNVNVAGGASATALDFADAGYTTTDPAFLKLQSDLAYSKQKYDEWNPANTSAYNLYNKDTKLVYAPLIDTSKVTTMDSMFLACKALTTVPLLNTSKVTTMEYMFQTCKSLITVPLLDTSKVTTMENMFAYCSSLTSIPFFDTSKVTTMGRMFNECSSLTSIPAFDLSSCTDCYEMFWDCSSLKKIPSILTSSNVETMYSMIHNCSSLTEIGELDCSSVKAGKMFEFGNNKNVTTLGGFKNLKVSVNIAGESWSPINKLDKQSLMNVINDLGTADPAFEAEPTLKIAATPFALLTPDDIAIATAKGWKVVSK